MHHFDIYEDDLGNLYDRQGHKITADEEIELTLMGQMLDNLTGEELMEVEA